MIILTEFDFKNELGPMPTYRHMCFNSDVIVKLVSKRQLIEEVDMCVYIFHQTWNISETPSPVCADVSK